MSGCFPLIHDKHDGGTWSQEIFLVIVSGSYYGKKNWRTGTGENDITTKY